MLVAFHYRRNKSGLIERTDYIYETNAKVYFFKNIDYIELNNFSAEDLVNAQGSKVNGYSALTKSKKIVDQTYIKNQIKTIDRILSEKAYKHWPTIVGQLQSNFRGLDKISSQMGKDHIINYRMNLVRGKHLIKIDDLENPLSFGYLLCSPPCFLYLQRTFFL